MDNQYQKENVKRSQSANLTNPAYQVPVNEEVNTNYNYGFYQNQDEEQNRQNFEQNSSYGQNFQNNAGYMNYNEGYTDNNVEPVSNNTDYPNNMYSQNNIGSHSNTVYQNSYSPNDFNYNAGYNANGAQQAYQNTNYNNTPVGGLKTNRGLGKFILLTIITLGIYSIIYYSSVSTDINIIASRYDGKKTIHYCLMFFLLGPITLYIFGLVWFTTLSSRIGNELNRRGIDYKFGASDFWLWNVLGMLIIVGPFVYIHKLSKAMNLLAQDYNYKG